MRTRQSLLTIAALAACLAAPAGALAQSAGDEQYTDPFAGQDQPADQQGQVPAEPAPEQPAGGGPVEGSTGGGDGSVEPAPSAAPAPSAEPAQAQGEAGTLPRTGLPAVALAAAGCALLLAGIAIGRKA